MAKVCVFCGKKPESKTKEHIIPEWLIKYTGDPNRIIDFGINYYTGQHMKFSFDQLHFPACDECNGKFAQWEDHAKGVIINILNEKGIDPDSFSLLLSWFDKVRIGLWLGYNMLNKGSMVDPKFNIVRGMDSRDRMLLIYKSDIQKQILWFYGINSPAFYMAPCCFCLMINNYCFINLSAAFMFSRRLGIPYPSKGYLTEEYGYRLKMESGLHRILSPLIRKAYNNECTEIYQPIIDQEFVRDKSIALLYGSEYTKKYLDLDFSNIGKVLLRYGSRVRKLENTECTDWIPKYSHNHNNLIKMVMKQVLEFQLWIIGQLPSSEKLSDHDRKELKESFQLAKRIKNDEIKKIDRL